MSESVSNSIVAPSLAPGPVRVAVVDSDPASRRLMRYWLENAGYQVLEASNTKEAERLSSEKPDLACIDLAFGGNPDDGVAVLRTLHAIDPRLPAVIVTAQRDVETAVNAMRAGAYDYVLKPLDPERLLGAMARARDRYQLLRTEGRGDSSSRRFSGFLSGRSKVMRELDRQTAKVLDRDVSVLLIGEHGAGKECLARTIHELGPRAVAPFYQFDCSSVDTALHEAKLFSGHDGRGLFELANGGVLYLDNIDRLSSDAQTTLALAMSGRMRRGEGAPNVRIIAGCQTDLKSEWESGRFREELYFRLVVFPLRLPSLRERREDIPSIVRYLLSDLGTRLGGSVPEEVAPEALELLISFDWPGNLRQLENVVQRAMIVASGKTIAASDLPPEIRGVVPSKDNPVPAIDFSSVEIVPLRELERRAIEHALKVTHGSVSLAAKRLGIGRATLYRRIASLDLSLDVA